MHPYQSPDFTLKAFNCPHCHAYSNQEKVPVFKPINRRQGEYEWIKGFHASICAHCGVPAFWQVAPPSTTMIFPAIVDAPQPNADIPEDLKRDFEEARQVEQISPRAAAALLRLVIQKLCKFLGESGKNINDDIGALVKKGLSPLIQQSLDIVRVIGNEAVHPGTIDLNDNRETARSLFVIVNLIAESQITQPKLVQSLFITLPADKRLAIEKRDEPKI